MALSDVCSDTLHNLADDLVNYSDWGYSPQQILPVIDAMYSLGSLGFELDTPPGVTHPNSQLAIHNIVLGAILETEDETYKNVKESKLKMLADLSKIDERTAEGLIAIYDEVNKNTESIILQFNPNVLNQLNEIRRYQQ